MMSAKSRTYSWMPRPVGDAFVYTPLSAVPLMWLSAVLWDRSVNVGSTTPIIEWLGYSVVFGLPLNYAALVILGIPAVRFLLRIGAQLPVFAVVGVLLGALTASIWPGWRLHAGWVLIGSAVGWWNGLLIGRAAGR